MLLDRVSNPGPLTYKSGALPIALRGPAICMCASIPFAFEGWMWDVIALIPDHGLFF